MTNVGLVVKIWNGYCRGGFQPPNRAGSRDMLLKPLNQLVRISANSWTDYGFRVKPGMTNVGWWVVSIDSG